MRIWFDFRNNANKPKMRYIDEEIKDYTTPKLYSVSEVLNFPEKMMSCRYAKIDLDTGRYECKLSGDECIYYIPNQKNALKKNV